MEDTDLQFFQALPLLLAFSDVADNRQARTSHREPIHTSQERHYSLERKAVGSGIPATFLNSGVKTARGSLNYFSAASVSQL